MLLRESAPERGKVIQLSADLIGGFLDLERSGYHAPSCICLLGPSGLMTEYLVAEMRATLAKAGRTDIKIETRDSCVQRESDKYYVELAYFLRAQANGTVLPEVMSNSAVSQRSEPAVPGGADLTGRSSLVSNVLFTWAAQMVFFAAGFIMPRMIDHKLGQEVLGVWDFSWSLVTYFRFVELGITSSVNRYVARHWGQHDLVGINRVVSSATFVLLVPACLIFLLTIGAAFSLPHFFGARLNDYVPVAQKSVFFLGATMSVGTALGAFNGVLTGCHRWELQSLRLSFWHLVTVAAMVVGLWLGAGLATLAAITAIGQTLGSLTMVTLAFRVCPGLRLQRSLVKWSTIKNLYVFSVKTLLPTVSSMLLNQTTSLLILGSLGPAALAVFTRPRSLLQQMDSLERKMAMILVPTTSSLESTGDLEEIRQLLVKSVRYSLYLSLPMIVVLICFGGKVMRLWMGSAYANGVIPAILAFGALGACVQTPILSMLAGLNAHGRGGLGQFVGSVVSAAAVLVSLQFLHSGLVGVAVAITLPLLIVNLFYLPFLLCRRLEQRFGTFYRQVTVRPLLHVLPFSLCLVIGRLLFEAHLILALIVCLSGAITLAFSYWRDVLPGPMKTLIRRWSDKVTRVAGFSFFGPKGNG